MDRTDQKPRSTVGEVGKTPCLDCYRTGHDCVLATSRRGGNYRKLRHFERSTTDNSSIGSLPRRREHELAASPQTAKENQTSSTFVDLGEEEPICGELRNPSDALQILAKATGCNQSPRHESSSPKTSRSSFGEAREASDCLAAQARASDHMGSYGQSPDEDRQRPQGIYDYELVAKGILQPRTIRELLQW